jgi:16S rRNA (guanine527-N7)-methyltransferase
LIRRFHVKHADLEAELANYLALVGLFPPPEQVTLLTRHIELVLEANQRVNLTRVTEPLAAVRLHTADSLSALEDVEAAPSGKLLDLGSGAGFPGVPLAVCTDRQSVLLDSVAKKIRELAIIVAKLGISGHATPIAGRAEAFARVEPGGFSVVTARAVSELPALVELACPLLSEDGWLICLKGSPSPDEMRRADRVATLVGMVLEYQRSFDLPEQVGHRTVLCYRKVASSSVALPRREGLAQHSPLA